MAHGFEPAASDVALYVPQRVTDITGAFTTTSVPTLAQVTSLIALAAEDVYAAAGDVANKAPDLINAAKHVTALGTAVRIEDGYTSNEAEEKSPRLDNLRKEYESALARLAKASQEGAGDVVPSPVYGFPDINDVNENAPGQTAHATAWNTAF
jgi:uncharacterized membrane protein YccC